MKQALEMALEALELSNVNNWWGHSKIDKAITAIKEALAQPDRHELQAKGEHPAPCARFCEANSFQIEIRSLKKQLEQAQNGWCKALEKLQIQPDKVCIENDGCPTEKAVLQRFWREHQKTKPEQEPVACIGYWNQKTGAYYKPDQISTAHQKLIEDGILRRCYTTPPQRKPLTDEQIDELLGGYYISHWGNIRYEYHRSIARAIEAAHGIKE